MTDSFDAIVVGGGTMGLAAALALAERGARCLVLEQFQLLHSRGSHGGRTRITRQAYAESPDYIPLVRRAEARWTVLEQEIGLPILHRCGGLDLQAPGYTWADLARDAAARHGVPHDWLTGAEIRHRWPAWAIGDEWEACYCPGTGFLEVEPALRAVAVAARRRGAVLQFDEPVREWVSTPAGIVVSTDRNRYRADRLVFTAGAWSGPLLQALRLPITVRRKVVWWLDVERPDEFAVGRFPIFITEGPVGSIYGFPIHGVPGIKMANHAEGEVTTAETVNREVRAGEKIDVVEFARTALPSITPRVLDDAVCLYSLTPDRDFIVDRHPADPKVVVAAGFSGHGFKFAPVIGEMLADLALDPTARPLPRFALSRFGRPKDES